MDKKDSSKLNKFQPRKNEIKKSGSAECEVNNEHATRLSIDVGGLEINKQNPSVTFQDSRFSFGENCSPLDHKSLKIVASQVVAKTP